MPNPKLINIQILRGLAAAWVVVYHALGLTLPSIDAHPALAFIGGYGYAGVDIFFVLSGFVIYYSVYSKPITAGEFFIRRAERIVPPYFLLTTVLFVATLLLPSMFSSLKASLDHFLRSIFYISFTGHQFPVMHVGWTLEYEMLFYGLGAAALAVGALAFKRLPVLLSMLSIVGMVATKMHVPLGPAGFLTNPIILEFGFGFVIAAFFRTRKISLADATALSAAIIGVAITDPMHRVLVAGLPSAALLWVCMALNSVITLPSYVRTPASIVGDASYSIYLIQVFSLPIIDKSIRRAPVELGTNSVVLLATGMTIFLGWAFFKWVETPMLNVIKARRKRNAGLPSQQLNTYEQS